jgi:5'-nucleotidase
MRILIDMDGVLADFDGEFIKRWRERYPEQFYIPMHERTMFYVKDQYPQEYHPQLMEILREPGFFREMMPMEAGREALHEMDGLGLDVFICTSPFSSYQNCVLEKYQWVEAYLGSKWTDRIILTKDKTLVRGDILIDDKPQITGKDVPTWEHILYDRPYNQGVDRRRLTWKNWKEVLGV